MSLTDEQIKEVWRNVKDTGRDMHDAITFARGVESATAAPLLERIKELEQKNQKLLDELRHMAQEIKSEQRLSFRSQCAELEKQLEAARSGIASVRNEALEEAAAECEEQGINQGIIFERATDYCAEAIRSMKSDVAL